MVLHELATNAIKYGALKQPNGHLAVRWRLETLGGGGKPWLQLDWKESGVEMPPAGANPKGTGQGRELIERALPYQFDAQTTFAMEPDGVHCTISLPVSELTLPGKPHCSQQAVCR
jgi:two-component sensor histidine kinase